MDNARVVLIVAALFVVLLSAFAAERLQPCGDGRCYGDAGATVTRAPLTPALGPGRTEADANPRPQP